MSSGYLIRRLDHVLACARCRVLVFGHELDPYQWPRERVPRDCLSRAFSARTVATWMVPTGMTSYVHVFDPREGGSFQISLAYDARTGTARRPRTPTPTTANLSSCESFGIPLTCC
jgi:hypothetical protein